MNNVIKLEFPDNLKVLAGNDYAREIYDNQIGPKIENFEHIELQFPDTIVFMCSSFVQGLFSKWLKTMSPDQIMAQLTIKNAKHLKDIKQGLYE